MDNRPHQIHVQEVECACTAGIAVANTVPDNTHLKPIGTRPVIAVTNRVALMLVYDGEHLNQKDYCLLLFISYLVCSYISDPLISPVLSRQPFPHVEGRSVQTAEIRVLRLA